MRGRNLATNLKIVFCFYILAYMQLTNLELEKYIKLILLSTLGVHFTLEVFKFRGENHFEKI